MKIITSLLLILLFYSCTFSESIKIKKSDIKLAIEEKRQINIHIDSITNYSFAQAEIFDTDSGLIFFGFDRKLRTINFYDIEKDSLILKSKLKNEGIGSFKTMPYYFSVISPDSILTIETFPMVFSRINSKAEVLEQIPINEIVPKGYEEAGAVTDYRYPIIFDKKTNTISFNYHYERDAYSHFKNKNSAIYDLNKKKFKLLYAHYPSNYKIAAKKNQMYGFNEESYKLKKGDTVIFNYPISNFLYRYNYNTGELIDSIYAKSSYITDDFSTISYENNYQKEVNYENEEACYEKILYDSYRDIYLRIVKHKQELRNAEGELNQFLNSDWSIMFLDNHFKLIDEIKFEKNIYNFDNIFIIKDGLLISTNNPFNPAEKEGVLSFDLFEMKLSSIKKMDK